MSAAQRISLSIATFSVMAVAILVLALMGYDPWIAVLAGIWWGLWPAGLFFGLINLIAPARVIERRERAIAGAAGYRKLLGDWFSRRLAIEGPRPWESQAALLRVRLLGFAQTVLWGTVLAVLIWLLPNVEHIGR